jgi:hypothetical protein
MRRDVIEVFALLLKCPQKLQCLQVREFAGFLVVRHWVSGIPETLLAKKNSL